MVHSVAKERVKKAEWAFMSTSIHKACKVVDGGGNPMPVVELDRESSIKSAYTPKVAISRMKCKCFFLEKWKK